MSRGDRADDVDLVDRERVAAVDTRPRPLPLQLVRAASGRAWLAGPGVRRVRTAPLPARPRGWPRASTPRAGRDAAVCRPRRTYPTGPLRRTRRAAGVPTCHQ